MLPASTRQVLPPVRTAPRASIPPAREPADSAQTAGQESTRAAMMVLLIAPCALLGRHRRPGPANVLHVLVERQRVRVPPPVPTVQQEPTPVLPQPGVTCAMLENILRPLRRSVPVAPRARFLCRKVPRLALRVVLEPTLKAPLCAIIARPTRSVMAMDARHAPIALMERLHRKEPPHVSTGARHGVIHGVRLAPASPTPTLRHAAESTSLSLVAVATPVKSRSRFRESERIMLARAPSPCREGRSTRSFRTTPTGTAGTATRRV